MAKAQTTIEINGRLYDALTGSPLKNLHPKPPTSHKKKPITKSSLPVRNSQVIDGFVRVKQSSSDHGKKMNSHQTTHRKSATHRAERTAKHAQTHRAHRAQTLVRHGVKKPQLKTERKHSETPKIRHASEGRLHRAKSTSRSGSIARFSYSHAKPEPHTHHTTNDHKKDKPAHKPVSQPQSTVFTPPVKLSAKEAAIAKALQAARSHEATKSVKKPKKRLAHHIGVSHRVVRLATVSAIVVLLGGFFAYQNLPNLSMRLAASRAGVDASLPSYHPSGFALSGPIEYGPGSITVTFNSNSDDRNYSIEQKTSNWNSQALVDNFILADDRQYQTFEEKGKTIYVYDNSNATWVNGGVWYTIEGNSALNTEQLLKIASSI